MQWYLSEFALFFFDDCLQFVVLGLFLDDFFMFLVHGIFPADVGLDGLDLFEYLGLVIGVVAVQMVVVSLDAFLQDLQDLVPHAPCSCSGPGGGLCCEFALRVDGFPALAAQLGDDLVQFLYFLDCLRCWVHLKLLEMVTARTDELPVCVLIFAFCICSRKSN